MVKTHFKESPGEKNKYDLKITLSQPQPEAKARFQNENLHLLFIVCE